MGVYVRAEVSIVHKCLYIYINVFNARNKRYKVLTEPRFKLPRGSFIRQLTPLKEWWYLGVGFRAIGSKLLRSGTSWTLKKLRALDKQVRGAIRR